MKKLVIATVALAGLALGMAPAYAAAAAYCAPVVPVAPACVPACVPVAPAYVPAVRYVPRGRYYDHRVIVRPAYRGHIEHRAFHRR